MFKDQPKDDCGVRKSVNVGTIGHVHHGKLTLTSSLLRVLIGSSLNFQSEEKPENEVMK